MAKLFTRCSFLTRNGILVLLLTAFSALHSSASCNASFTYTVNHAQGKVYLTGTSTGNNLAYQWWVNGTFLSGPNVSWPFPGQGYYPIRLTVFDTFDSTCYSTRYDTLYVSASNPCNANFYFHKDSFPGGSLFWFIPQYTDTFASHLWTFGDGDSSFYPSPNHQFPGPGLYRVCHTVYNFFDSCYAKQCDTVVVTDSIKCNVDARFYFYKDSMNKYHFVPQHSQAPGNLYYWSFGDGQTSNQQYPVHQYNSQAWYHLVCLTVVNPLDSMCFDHFCDTVPIMPDSVCQADARFTYQLQQKDSLGNYKIYRFIPNYLNAAAYNYYWEFEPVNASTQPSPLYLFNTVTKTRWVCLTVTSKNNPACKDRYCDTLIIDSGCGANAKFTYARYSNVPTAFRFYSQGSSQYIHSWTFGTNQSYTESSPLYTFPSTGVYQVCHMVRKMNDSTCFDQFCDSVLITPAVCNAQFYDTSFMQGTEVMLWPVAIDSSATYIWSFGNGDSATGVHPFYTYRTAGTYNVCLIVYSASDTCKWCRQIIVGSATGLNSSETDQSITSLYPNPVIDRLQVEIYSRTAETIQLQIIGITGQVEHKQATLVPAGSSKIEIDTRLLKQGIHFLELKTNETAVRSKFVK